tara:strand:+ start:497 stop:682 length:186 start_codon:yes stop_codon:yes gene_type:complete
MTSSNITMSSTKQQIVDSAQELIGNLEDKLDTTSRLHIEREEERNSVIIVLVIVSLFSILF